MGDLAPREPRGQGDEGAVSGGLSKHAGEHQRRIYMVAFREGSFCSRTRQCLGNGIRVCSSVDLDGCRNESGQLNPIAAAIVDELDSYAEWSPSGSGVHLIARGRLQGRRCRRGPIEIYDRGRYFTVTGQRLEGVPHSPMPRQRELDDLWARLFPKVVSPPGRSGCRAVPEDDRDLLERVFAAKNGVEVERLFNGDTSCYGSHSEADLALVSHLAFWTNGDPERIDALFRASGLMREKWLRPDYRQRTIAKALG